jgi:phosphohistidine phosphatase SixA
MAFPENTSMISLLISGDRRPQNAAAIRALIARVLTGLLLTLSASTAWSSEMSPDASTDAWTALQTGKAVAIMRHALAPGISDPMEFDINDCATQRNLSDQGRQQARRIGEAIRARGIESADVFSSAWCRCVDTAQALGFGEVTVLESLNSFFEDRSTSSAQTDALRQWIERRLATPALSPALLVSHQVNLSALTGRPASSGELLIVTLDGNDVLVLGSLAVPP